MTIVASIGGVVALVALALWLASRSDALLARWSAVAGVISALVTILALVAALVPLWRHDDGGVAGDTAEQRPARTTITQNIRNKGSANVVGEGTQVNIDLGSPPRDGR